MHDLPSLDDLREEYQHAYRVTNEIASVIDELGSRLTKLEIETCEIHCLRALANGLSGVSDYPISSLSRMARRLGIDDAEGAA